MRRFALLLLVHCAVPVAAALDENDANEIVIALDQTSIDSTKEIDPQTEGKFRVTVARDDVPRALQTMRDDRLPHAHSPGVLDAMDKGALVPSQATEHAQYATGLGGDLQKTLEGVDGVLTARVHLNLPTPDPLRDTPPPKATASVLIEHRGSTPPLTIEAVQRLVAGGVGGLAPNDVIVVMVPRAAPVQSKEAQLSHVGPIAVARSSAKTLQIAMGALCAAVALLAALAVLFYVRLSRARAELEAKQ